MWSRSSPTGATLHALHYHQVLVSDIPKDLEKTHYNKARDSILGGLLQIPVTATLNWSETEKQQEFDNNAQGNLGYVVPWVNQGLAQPSGYTEPLLHAWRLKVKAK